MNAFAIDFTNRQQVIDFAALLSRRNPQFTQFVVKHPDRDNFNITMQIGKALADGCEIVWSSRDMN